MATPNTGIPYVPEGTQDPAAGLNNALFVIDALLQLRVLSMSEDSPPGSPSDGDRYVVGDNATGAWAGQDNNLAVYVAEGDFWKFYEAGTQVSLVVNSDGGLWAYIIGTGWTLIGGLSDAPIDGTGYVRKDGAWEPESGTPGATDFTDLGDTPGSYSGSALAVARVNSAEDGLEFHPLGSMSEEDAEDYTPTEELGSLAFLNEADLSAVAETGLAKDVSYDNADSGLSATDVQAAIDEVAQAAGGIPDAPSDGKLYGRKDAEWEEVDIQSGVAIPALLLSAQDELGPAGASELGDLPSAGALAGDALVYLVDPAGNSVRTNLAALKVFINTDPSIVPSSSPWAGATVKRTANLPVPNEVEISVPWQAATEDTDSIWSAGNPTRLTVPVGVTRVRLSASVQYAASNSVHNFLIISKNGGDFDGRVRNTAAGTEHTSHGMTGQTADIPVVAGDYFELKVFQSSGGNLDIVAGTALWFSMTIVERQP